ncbi:MAG TPA: pyridoxal-phosphate dependent enzyme, partial [Beutenbergiaceae bacterium]|nr:pyridoxal-phosphate dependent enzyme [Beutenbergiaceae bacterium]
GLLAGVSTALRLQRGKQVDIYGVQARGAAAYPQSLTQGEPVSLSSMSTMADGIAVGTPGNIPFEVIQREVDGIELVGEEEISQALLLLAERAKLVVEPSGAVGVAAAINQAGQWPGPIVIVLTGGNIDPLVLMRVLRHGMTSAGRFLTVAVRVPDHPGSLAGLLTHLAESKANILTVRHTRTSPTLPVGEVDIAVEMETRGAQHCKAVVKSLVEAGYHLHPT